MKLGMSLQPRLSLKQGLRQSLEQRLDQKLSQQIELKIRLEQYLAQEGIIKGFIEWATEHNSWKKFNKAGFNFTYAALPYDIAEPIADIAGPGFAHCQYDAFEALFYGQKIARAKGDWTLFVVEDMIPKGLVEPVAIHERGEEISLGNHFFASQLEFAYVTKNNKLGKYMEFIDRDHPSKFIDLTQKVVFPILPQELIEFLESQEKRNRQEILRAEELIEGYPLSTKVLKLMDKYEKITQRFCDSVNNTIAPLQREIYDMDIQKRLTVDYASNIINDGLSEVFLSLTPEEARVVSRTRAGESLRNFHDGVIVSSKLYDIVRRNFNVPSDFGTAYKDAINGKRLVTAIKTREDLSREKEQNESLHTYSAPVALAFNS